MSYDKFNKIWIGAGDVFYSEGREVHIFRDSEESIKNLSFDGDKIQLARVDYIFDEDVDPDHQDGSINIYLMYEYGHAKCFNSEDKSTYYSNITAIIIGEYKGRVKYIRDLQDIEPMLTEIGVAQQVDLFLGLLKVGDFDIIDLVFPKDTFLWKSKYQAPGSSADWWKNE